MKNKFYLLIGVLLIGIFLTNNILGDISNCCEKTKVNSDGSGGAWCVDASENECDISYDNDLGRDYFTEPTACISTSYCALGTCINKRDGDCMENTPQRSCDSSLGFWSSESSDDIPQCQLGCCAVGDQAAFVTQIKCKSFASLYSIDTHFQPNIQDEITCIASAFPESKGACTFEREFETTCKMTTRSECKSISGSKFHEEFLCTADELATNCAVTDKTTCVKGADEVYFLDSCGNVANVYDSSMIKKETGQVVPNGENGKLYWKYITAPTCGNGANAGSASCGDCNYYDGSTCKQYDRNEDSVKPNYGDNICRDLDCEWEGKTYLHGESWCADAPGITNLDVSGGTLNIGKLDSTKTSLPGSRFIRLVCYNGEVTVEPCADRRAEVCIESTRIIPERNNVEFTSSVCRVNKWQDCVSQLIPGNCEDTAIRDCQWIGISNKDCIDLGDCSKHGKCVPLVAPGFDFWKSSTSSSNICSLASTTCTAHFTQSLAQQQSNDWTQEDGTKCFNEKKDYKDTWGTEQNKICVSLGDCKGKSSRGTIEKIKNYLQFLP